MTELYPIVVDLDDTLVLTDTLHENLITLIKNNPVEIFKLPTKLTNGKAAFKNYVYQNSQLEVDSLPYRKELIEYLTVKKQEGHKIILATAANEEIANTVAAYLGIFDQVLGSSSSHNLRGENKLQAIQQYVGKEFIYAGDHSVDLPIWKVSKGAIIAGNKTSELSKELAKHNIPVIKLFENPKVTLKTWVKAIRVHQWLKNGLLFVPLLVSFNFLEISKLLEVFLAFIAFSLGASATYILNDLWDLSNDRKHKRKCKRPFASGVISIPKAVKASIILLTTSFILSYWVSPAFFLIFILYLIITTLYSLKFKKEVLVDITILSILYTMRILAGGVVSNIGLSYWLISFSIFIFLSLATMKRCGELVSMADSPKNSIVGRGYSKSDLNILWPLGISSYIGAIILFGLYINDPITISNFNLSEGLWGVQLVLFYLVGNLWIKTKHGFMHDDPIVYLIKDKKSLILIFIMIILFLISHNGINFN